MQSDAALAKKRQFALERAERLKDPRMRVMGVDKAALDEQVREKQQLQQLEGERNAYFDKQALLMDRHAQVLQREVDELRAKREKELVDYRATFQKKQCSREWDLNDPRRVGGALPARIGDEDVRCGAASLQRFEGEDLDSKARRAAQAAQQKAWADAQTDEKLMKKWMEKEANRTYEDRAEETAFRTWQIEQQIAQQRAEAARTAAEFNKALAEQKRREKVQDRFRQTQKNLEEIDNMLNSDFLNETEGTVSDMGNTIKRERFKGLTAEQRENILRTQEAQREELRQRKLQEAEEERQMAQQEAMENRMGAALDRQRQRERREAALALGREHQHQAEQARLRKQQLDEQYRNKIGEEYFVWGKCLD